MELPKAQPEPRSGASATTADPGSGSGTGPGSPAGGAPAVIEANAIARLEAVLRPAGPEVIDDAIDLILEGHGGRRTNEAKARAYCIALEDLPAAAIARGVADVLKRRVPELDPKFPPTAPQLREICAVHRDRDADALTRLRRRRDRLLTPPPKEIPPEEHARVAAGLTELADQLRRDEADRSLAAAAGRVVRASAAGAEATARDARIAEGLAGRDFPVPPSQVGAAP